ncbi:MAG: anhydro-N-acetylmuramic acid kinase [Alphaproteobacteria bacterium]|nr:anhydro-N-acetylmuramic acid kinase [Alphaproteobacteria bacterium]
MVIKPLNILGLMSGTSLDGVKVSLVSTDGIDVYQTYFSRHYVFDETLRTKIRSVLGKKINIEQEKSAIDAVENDMSEFLINIVNEIKLEIDIQIDAIGLEGPTICNEPHNHYTYQLGKGKILADKTGIDVVTHFHNADILNGGLGSPISATYYNALAQNLGKPIAFINIGGITNITWIGLIGEIVSFDCGPGNALIDDWVSKHGGVLMDYNGKFAATGQVNQKIVSTLLKHNFFAKYPPKTLDRNEFNNKIEHLEGLSLEDGAATVTAFVAEAISYSLAFYLPEVPAQAIICGGGAKNPTLLRFVRNNLKSMNIATLPESELDEKTDDATAIAFLAARRIYSLPITFPTTTGINQAMTGGEIYKKE